MQKERTEETNSAVEAIQNLVAGLSLSDSDFHDDTRVAKVRDFSKAVQDLEIAFAGSETWLTEWLSAEHYKGALLYTSAKTNWAEEQSSTLSAAPFDPQSRGKK
ncbi:hypothetical protein D6T64_01325 [Cryobacterium melibiosiphilum]|uniref:Uncharacterized protein n=1 Tax=Cryobacterium melibiosiphilum TaxID=995039 RepID=A0A3A5MRZ4_9MICO|nr:hypothetical protein [Cryobacterium melibiosiphilum]RJT91755.1 hypothetical protein D6T64_01325 [Cryobacterium melibiosiphilum]